MRPSFIWGRGVRALLAGPSLYWGGLSLIGGVEPIYTRLRWNTDTKATSKKTVSERLLSQRSTATIPHNQFAHVLLGNLLAARSSSFLLAPQEKKKKKKRNPRAARLIDCLSNRYSPHYWSLLQMYLQQLRLYYFTLTKVSATVDRLAWLGGFSTMLSLWTKPNAATGATKLCGSTVLWKGWRHFRSNNGSIKNNEIF